MKELDLVAKELFNKIRNRFSNLRIADDNLQTTLDPDKARYYYFDFEKANESDTNTECLANIFNDSIIEVTYIIK